MQARQVHSIECKAPTEASYPRAQGSTTQQHPQQSGRRLFQPVPLRLFTLAFPVRIWTVNARLWTLNNTPLPPLALWTFNHTKCGPHKLNLLRLGTGSWPLGQSWPSATSWDFSTFPVLYCCWMLYFICEKQMVLLKKKWTSKREEILNWNSAETNVNIVNNLLSHTFYKIIRHKPRKLKSNCVCVFYIVHAPPRADPNFWTSLNLV